jgi:hypothetical protein
MEKRNTVRFVCTLLFLTVLSSTSFAETPWKFAVTCDSRGDDNGVNTTILGELATELVNQGVDFVLFAGDQISGYSDSQAVLESQLTTWRNTMSPVYNAGIPVYGVRGNHEYSNNNSVSIPAWNNIFPELPDNGPAGEVNLTYSVTHKSTFLIGFDQYIDGQIHRINQTWLDNQLAANTQPHIFVFGHEPAFKAQHDDCLDDYPVNRDAFWVSIENAGGRTYFCGHDHFYDHAWVDNDGDPNNDIHQYIVGTAGAPLRDWSPPYDGNNSYYTVENISHVKQYGYVLGEIDGLDVTLTWMERTGAGTYTAGDTWSYTAALPGDINGDGTVDFKDFAILADNWLSPK